MFKTHTLLSRLACFLSLVCYCCYDILFFAAKKYAMFFVYFGGVCLLVFRVVFFAFFVVRQRQKRTQTNTETERQRDSETTATATATTTTNTKRNERNERRRQTKLCRC